jgi:Fe-S cluster biogenesis protein NfuA
MTDIQTFTASDTDRIRRFVVETDTPIAGPGRHRYATPEEARGQPVAEAILTVPGVQEVILEGNAILVLRREDFAWAALEDRIGYAISTALGFTTPDAGAEAAPPPSDDEIYGIVERVFERDINPVVAQHGGRVDLIDVQDATVVVRMMGGCQGCGMANVTLRQGIESQLRRMIPGLRGLRDITDHSAGENPYFK